MWHERYKKAGAINLIIGLTTPVIIIIYNVAILVTANLS